MMKILSIALVLPVVAGCTPMASAPGTTAQSAAGPAATAILRDASGADRGTATVTPTDMGMRITVMASGMTPGPKGLHIHAVGKCEAPKFMTAGSHWNPDMKQHGRDNPMGAHIGDLPNIDIGADGRGTATIDVMSSPATLMAGEGKSVIIHAAADDYRTDPTGNSGDRIACGVFVAG